jgi:uncharacterized glyoxalase superfamily protein PhnB
LGEIVKTPAVLPNRSVPNAQVIPELAYDDVGEASDWLCDAFGFRERVRIGEHRAQLVFGEGAMIVIERGENEAPASSVLVRVEDADSHYERAESHGARIVRPPTDYPYGERQYTAEDLGGHRWTFSQSIADVDPRSWGATRINLD